MWSSIIPLIAFVVLGIIILIVFELRARRTAKEQADADAAAQAAMATEEDDEGCCGSHLVCERETLLQTNAEIIYYDDEELDALAGIPAEDYTAEQYAMIREVFNTMQSKDVPGWVRSIQLRNIQLPLDIREEALLIVIERRHM